MKTQFPVPLILMATYEDRRSVQSRGSRERCSLVGAGQSPARGTWGRSPQRGYPDAECNERRFDGGGPGQDPLGNCSGSGGWSARVSTEGGTPGETKAKPRSVHNCGSRERCSLVGAGRSPARCARTESSQGNAKSPPASCDRLALGRGRYLSVPSDSESRRRRHR